MRPAGDGGVWTAEDEGCGWLGMRGVAGWG